MKLLLLVVAGSSFLRVCGSGSAPARPNVSQPPGSAGPHAMRPEHNGSVATSGGIVAEVSAQPDGRLVAFLRDPSGAPVRPEHLELSIRRGAGDLEPVAVSYDEGLGAYVGRPSGIAPGAYAMEVSVRGSANAVPVEIVTPAVTITAETRVPAPRHGGRVRVVGDHAVEMVVARTGDVAMFYTDLEGRPIPTAEIEAPAVEVTVGDRVRTARTRVVNGAFVAHFDAAPTASAVVVVPDLVVRHVRYPYVAVAHVEVVETLPTVVLVASPTVVVERPASQVIIVERPEPPVIVLTGHGRGHGWGHGRGHGHGGGFFVVPTGRGHRGH